MRSKSSVNNLSWFLSLYSPQETSRGIHELDGPEPEAQGVDDHAQEREEINEEGGGLVGVGLVQDDAAHHGAGHSADDDQETNSTGVLLSILSKFIR